MNTEIRQIIQRLERQAKTIETALSALRALDGNETTAIATTTQPMRKGARRKGQLSEEGRRRISEALKARWAARRAANKK